MSKKNKKQNLKKTLVEKILDQHKIPYSQLQFNVTQHGDVKQIDTTILAEDNIWSTKLLFVKVTKIHLL